MSVCVQGRGHQAGGQAARSPRGCVLRLEALGAQLPEGRVPRRSAAPASLPVRVPHAAPPRLALPASVRWPSGIVLGRASSCVGSSLARDLPLLRKPALPCVGAWAALRRNTVWAGGRDGEVVNVWPCFHRAEFKKTDKSILVSPTGPSRVAFNPEQKPLHGVLKTPTSSPISTLLGTKKPLTATPRRRPTAMDFF